MNEYVNLDGLHSASNIIYYRKDDFNKLFNESLFPLLEESRIYLDNQKNGYLDLVAEFEKLKKELNMKLESLSTILDSSVIKDYKEAISEVTSLFNSDFGKKFNDILNSDKSDK